MKKLLLAFSLIAIFGIGITTASITLPNDQNDIEKKNSDKKNDNNNLSNKSLEFKNNESCCTKTKES